MSVSSSASTANGISSMFTNKLDKMFNGADADKDGKLNFAEFMTAGQNLPGAQASETAKSGKSGKHEGKGNLLQQLMAILDQNSDGDVSKDEASSVKDKAMKDLFAALDNMRDGKKPVKKQGTQGSDASREKLFKAIDKDGDGNVTKDEMKSFHDQKINEARAAILQVQELFGSNMAASSAVGSAAAG